jgi:hypothetical protein
MIPARPLVIALLLSAGISATRADDDFGKRLDLCIGRARQADAACSSLTDAPTERLECFQKARAEQLSCLEHALSDPPAGATASDDHPATSWPEQPAKTVTSDGPLRAASPQERAQAKAEESSHTTSEAKSQEGSRTNTLENVPLNSQLNAQTSSQKSPETAQKSRQNSPAANAPEPLQVGTTVSTTVSTTANAPADASQVAAGAVSLPQSVATRAAVRSSAGAQTVPLKDVRTDPPKPGASAAKPPESSWLVSETTSPIDYQPLLTAVIRPTSSSPGGPSRLAVRCRGAQTELLIQADGTWPAPRRKALAVDRQINDRPVVHEKWGQSVDAKTAAYTGDAIELLKSLSEGARLMINVPDGANARHEATFLLTGWDAVRKKIEAACKWPKTNAQASSGQR